MAFDIRITGVPRDSSNPIWVIKDIRYPIDQLEKDKLFRLSVDSTMYTDYVAVLNTEEALVLHNKYRLEPYSEKGKKAEAELIAHLNIGAPKTRWVIFEIYEWES
jgi:hypothetical protein